MKMGHQGSVENKIKSIEYLDDQVIKTVVEAMDGSGEPYRLPCLDHPHTGKAPHPHSRALSLICSTTVGKHLTVGSVTG